MEQNERKKRLLLMIGPLEAEVIGILNELGEATAMAIWEELTRRGRKTAYTTVLTVLSRLYTRGFINKREKVINNIRQYVYELAIPYDVKSEIIREHVDLIVKMFGKDAIKIIRDYLNEIGAK
ncbi:MAG: BlaI/MecI/CopY family transcriptional regulator [Vulcanisaeta sp.]|jgi:predicted transcriptional regulator|nr:MAG: CopY family transcriptional regulator [Vulcanisaeta sp. OSP_8]KUO80814.1 MAG: CopY family transcriptional regulator [Vulcanisaeta sp. JCHS_4]KUO88994.1 MAG: CopY family transcriptional regulator [Vulcanisaeta sp. MG_3]KUO93411.1 MAG: CopY family transcriptional regulator [Vulcanisaeta sp. CIS_19]MCG2864523.1 BlaI/MecI/CopY family transcriptional regulator [Vulcanisaeta sp.]PVU72188.1 CopY family transcriptional regulator [Vulcanisaeta sp. SCGC AB-777_J10]